jgi:hypothetical protein
MDLENLLIGDLARAWPNTVPETFVLGRSHDSLPPTPRGSPRPTATATVRGVLGVPLPYLKATPLFIKCIPIREPTYIDNAVPEVAWKIFKSL